MIIPVHSSTIRRAEMHAVLTCMVDEKIGPGEMNKRLISRACEKLGFAGAQAFRSPAIALRYALDALDFPKESSIMISALAPSWQYVEIERRGNTALVLDVDEHSGLLSAESIENGIKNGGRCLLLHHTLGIMTDMQAIAEFGIPVIEDISLSVGGIQAEKPSGSFGTFAILGLEEKDLLTAGGGALLLAAQRRNATVLKQKQTIPSTDLLPDINAALALEQIRHLEKNAESRKEMYSLYLQSLGGREHKTFPIAEGNAIYSFPVVFERGTADAQKYAQRKGIATEAAFAGSVVDMLDEAAKEYPVARSLFLRSILFPLYPRLGAANAQNIAKIIARLP